MRVPGDPRLYSALKVSGLLAVYPDSGSLLLSPAAWLVRRSSCSLLSGLSADPAVRHFVHRIGEIRLTISATHLLLLKPTLPRFQYGIASLRFPMRLPAQNPSVRSTSGLAGHYYDGGFDYAPASILPATSCHINGGSSPQGDKSFSTGAQTSNPKSSLRAPVEPLVRLNRKAPLSKVSVEHTLSTVLSRY